MATKRKIKIKDPDLLYEAWRRGILSWKLYPYQQEIYDLILNATSLKVILNLSRRWGKSHILSLIAIEYALRKPNQLIRFACSTQKNLKKILLPLFRSICSDAPKEFKPVWKSQDSMFYFPSTQSEIHLSGTDGGNLENLRGQKSDLNVVDEAAFCTDLEYLYKSVLLPQTIHTKAKTILASTPCELQDSDFYKLCEEADAEGSYYVRDIYSNKSLDEKTIALYAKESGGVDSVTFKREYLCQFLTESNRLIIPEWQESYIQEYPKNDKFHNFYHKYVFMDLGFMNDYTAILWGYYDFLNAKLVVEDEWYLKGAELTTELIRDVIKERETKLWGTLKPLKRVADNNNPILLNDLSKLHGITFIPTTKDELHAMVNQTREFIGAGRLIIHPKCTYTINCLKYGAWDIHRKAFAHSKTYAHYDALAALIYGVRSIDQKTNPVPVNYGLSEVSHWNVPQPQSVANAFIRKIPKRRDG